MAHDEEAQAPLVCENNDSHPDPPRFITLNHQKDIHILSCSFLLIFLAYGAAQNLESTINTEGDLGTTSLGILYLSFAVCSLFASLVVKKLGAKNALVLGTTGYWLFVAANLKANWYTMVPASLYLGFAASIIWVGEGTYLTSAARSHSLDYNLHEESVIGKFNGEFWGMFALHQVVGNLITLFLLKDGEEGTTSGTTLLFIVFLCLMSLGVILMSFLSKRKGKDEVSERDSAVSSSSSVMSLLTVVTKLLMDRRMLLIIPLIAYSGLQQAFVWDQYTKFIVEPALGESGVGGAMAVYGFFDAICSLATGRLTSGLKSITVIVIGGACAQAIVYLWLLINYSVATGVLGIVYPVLIAALLGIGDGVLMTQLSALLGILFKHDLEGAFAQLKLWQSVSIAILFFTSPYTSLHTMVVIMLAVLLISLVSFLFLMLKRLYPRWPLLLTAATWTTLLTLMVGMASFAPEMAFVYAVTPNSLNSKSCSAEGYVRVPLDFPHQVFCFPAQLLKRSKMDFLVPPIFAAVVVVASAYAIKAFGMWEGNDDDADGRS